MLDARLESSLNTFSSNIILERIANGLSSSLLFKRISISLLSIDEISQDRNDLFSAIVSAKDGVIEDIRSLPGVLQNFAPLLQGLGNFN